MENNLNLIEPEVAPAPVKAPETQPIINPEQDPDEDDPWVIPAPLVPTTPKA